MSVGYDLPIRSRPHPVSIADRLPRKKNGAFLIPGLGCPNCHDLKEPSTSDLPAHGLRTAHNPDLGGCGAQLIWSVTDDGIALVTPEKWASQHGDARTFGSDPMQDLFAQYMKSATLAMEKVTVDLEKLNVRINETTSNMHRLSLTLNKDVTP